MLDQKRLFAKTLCQWKYAKSGPARNALARFGVGIG